MSYAAQHTCDACGKTSPLHDDEGAPAGWYGVAVYRPVQADDDPETTHICANADACSTACFHTVMARLMSDPTGQSLANPAPEPTTTTKGN